MLRCPNQGYHPPNDAPSQKKVQQENRQQIALAARERNDRRQEVHHESEAEEGEEEDVSKKHGYLPLAYKMGRRRKSAIRITPNRALLKYTQQEPLGFPSMWLPHP